MDINEAKQNTMASARKKASANKRGNAAAPPSSGSTKQPLTSYAAFKQRKQASIHYLTTASGITFELQPVSPGMQFMLTGTPLMQIAQDNGLDWHDDDERQQAVIRKHESMTIEDTEEYMQRICCAGITSLNFVMKPASACNEQKEELPVAALGDDLLEIFSAIMAISLPESEGEAFATFRGTGEAEQEQPNPHPPNSEGIPPEADGDTVSTA